MTQKEQLLQMFRSNGNMLKLKCRECGIVGGEDVFNKREFMSGKWYCKIGLCKKCKSNYNKKYAQKNKDKIKSQKRKYEKLNREKISKRRRKKYVENREKILTQKKVYYKENKSVVLKRWYDYRQLEENKIKLKARDSLRWAVEGGIIIKPENCSKCGGTRIIHGHHEDYNKPLEVVWLCSSCHKQLHVRKKHEEYREAI